MLLGVFLSLFVATGVLSYLFGRYWLKNPDSIMEDSSELYCWAATGTVRSGTVNWHIYDKYGPYDPIILITFVNVTSQMITWFKLGFFLQILGMLGWLILGLAEIFQTNDVI